MGVRDDLWWWWRAELALG